ncbi:DMT family transporter [Tsukamurella sp. PLM1]|uniref:EamA family transporter n=1 Tax=Tsukamurella sp. PLM1 TaxID=2929795 RepID=UPI002050C12E|nr:hypothetical protein MTP03_20420 [Tsukamurella sp. PLM1]
MTALLIPAMFVIGAISQYVGASLGVGLFEHLSPVAVAWLRGAGAGIILLVALRPRRANWSAARLRAAALFGTVTVLMNMAFYTAIAHIDLGTAVAIEFLGPIAVAVVGSRRHLDLLAAAGALIGVVSVAGVNVGGVSGADGALGVARSSPRPCGRATSYWASAWRTPAAGSRASAWAWPRARSYSRYPVSGSTS